jgi:hypothetical protein
VVLGSILLWFCTGRCVLLGEGTVKSGIVMLSTADLVGSLREHNARALDQLLLGRFGGKVGRGLALEVSRQRAVSIQAKSLFTPVLTHLRNDGKASEVSS